MKKLILVFLSFTLFSCLKEPKKEQEVTYDETLESGKDDAVVNKSKSDLDNVNLIRTLEKIVSYSIPELEEWAKPYNYELKDSQNYGSFIMYNFNNKIDNTEIFIYTDLKKNIYLVSYVTTDIEKVRKIKVNCHKQNYYESKPKEYTKNNFELKFGDSNTEDDTIKTYSISLTDLRKKYPEIFN